MSERDGDFVIAHEDLGFAGTWTFSLFGAERSGSTAFAGTATRQRPASCGRGRRRHGRARLGVSS